jgi:hypothetical protein
MKGKTSRIAAVLLVVLVGGVGLTSGETALTGVHDSLFYVWAGYSCGWEFTPQADIEVTKLGCWTPNACLGYEHRISIYDAQGNEVAFAKVPPNRPDLREADGYTYVVPESQNRKLKKDATYTIASFQGDTASDYDVFHYGSHSGQSSLIGLGELALYSLGQTEPANAWTGNEFLTANFQFEPLPTTIPVLIDVKPGSFPNSVNINGNGVIPVAILGSEDFDASWVDPETLVFAGLEVNVVGRNKLQVAIQDVAGPDNGPPDGYADLVVHFADDTALWEIGEDSNAVLKGSLLPDFGGTPIEGADSVRVVSE